MFLLSLLAKNLQNNDIEINTLKKADEKFKDIEIVSLQSFFSLINQNKYELHFKFRKNIKREILGDPKNKEKFSKKMITILAKKMGINEKKIIFTDIHRGCVAGYLSLIDLNPREEKEALEYLKILNKIIFEIDKKPIFETLQISPELLDKKGNRYKDWGINEKRGKESYIPPIKEWCGIGLKVRDKYDNGNNAWLDYRNKDGEYAIAYFGINNIYNNKEHIIEDIRVLSKDLDFVKNKLYIKEKNIRDNSEVKKECGEGVCVFQNPDYAENSSGYIQMSGYIIKMMLMCRVNPDDINQPKSFQECWIINPKGIRPYRILIKKIPCSPLTDDNSKNLILFTVSPDQDIIKFIKSNDFSFLKIINEKRFQKVAFMDGKKVSDDDFVIRLYTSNYYSLINNYIFKR